MIQQPLPKTMNKLRLAYNFFNAKFFENQLPPCIITLNRKAKAAGFYVNQLWEHSKTEERGDEISINPDTFRDKGAVYVLQTLLHEMCHQWQFHHGKPSRNGYHNKEWAVKMEAVGLMPSNTGRPGGKKVGQKMSDYPIEGGPFLKCLPQLEKKGFDLDWTPANLSPVKVKQAKKKRKTKYSCPSCANNLWGKPEMNILCVDCAEIYEEEKQ